MDKIHSFAKVVLEKAAEIVLEKDIELLEQRSFYLAKAKVTYREVKWINERTVYYCVGAIKSSSRAITREHFT